MTAFRKALIDEPGRSTGSVSYDDAEAAMEDVARLLAEKNYCDLRTLDRARRVAQESGQRLDRVLIQLGFITERVLAETYSSLLGLPVAIHERYPVDAPLFPEKLTAKYLRQARALPVSLNEDVLVVVCADPFDSFTAAAIAAATGHSVTLEVGIPIELEAAIDRLYPEEGRNGGSKVQADDGASDNRPDEEDAERLKDLASEAPVIRMVSQIISRAVETKASDIHIEPFEDRLRIRYRCDGVLHEAESPSARLIPAIISRVKIMAKLDIAERRLPQDGRIKMAVRGADVDFRVSTVPSLHGETVVIRVLDRNVVVFDYEQLGLPKAVVARLTETLDQTNGIVLVTGPTGSGKTTTLYTSLLALNSVTRKIITAEDPIEYQLAGINQIQVKEPIGLRFDTLLRSILRQDPDVIMVGEIRNLETAQMAVQAALTGHLVLSTLHTNSAASTITRLRDMGVEDYLITAVLRGVLAQRLIRRLCLECRRGSEAPPELVERFGLRARQPDGPIRLFHAVGCPKCRNTGFQGRLAIAEFLVMNSEIERLIFQRADQATIEQASMAAGMVTMFQSGLDAALKGTTTIEEVVRSIRADG